MTSRDKQCVIKLSWNDISKIVSEMALDIKQNEGAEVIVTIQRGGLIPGVMLSHLLSIRDFITIDTRVTKDDSINSDKNPPILVHNESIHRIRGKRVILVDDIVGSGSTHKAVIEYIMKYNPLSVRNYICVINRLNWKKYNKNSAPYNTFFGMEVCGWVKFPWE